MIQGHLKSKITFKNRVFCSFQTLFRRFSACFSPHGDFSLSVVISFSGFSEVLAIGKAMELFLMKHAKEAIYCAKKE